jgi:hypothetical protein
MSERQQRIDQQTANFVARGVNIMAVRDREIACRYMEFYGVPAHVIARVLDHPEARRPPSAGQRISEAIVPSPPSPQDD